MPDLVRSTALAVAAMAVIAAAPAEVDAGRGPAQTVTSGRTGWRRAAPRLPKKVRGSLDKASFRGSVGIRKGLVGVGGMGGDIEVVVRSRDEAKARGVRRVAGVMSVGPSTAIGTGRIHVSHDRALIPKVGTWSYSLGPRSKRSPTQGDGIGIPTFNPFIGVTVSRLGGFGIKLAGWPTPLGGWPFVYGTANVGVNHPALERASRVVLDRADRFERWMWRVTAPVRKPVVAAAKRVARRVKKVAAALAERTRRPQPGVGLRPGTPRVKIDRATVIGEGATSMVYATRDGKHVVKQMKPVIKQRQPISRAGRMELAHRTVAGMDLLRDAGLPIPAAWIERGHPDSIVQTRVTDGLTLSELSGVARLRARTALIRLNVRAARELWPRRTFGWIDAGSSNVRFDRSGRVVSWFDPVSPIKHRRFRLGPERRFVERLIGTSAPERAWGRDDL